MMLKRKKEPVVAEDAQPENEDEPPEGISKKAQERFRKLTTRLKERESEFERVNSDLGSIRTMMQETGGKPEDFAKTFEYIRALNKGDFSNARSILEDQIKQLTVLTGQPFTNIDALQQFPDLRERVNSYQMDEQTALEMARHRSIQQAQNNQQMQYEQQQRSQYESTQIKQHAINEIDRMGAEWAKTDPDYAFKEGLITAKAQMITQQFPPSQWATQVKLMYDTISSMPMQRKSSNAPACRFVHQVNRQGSVSLRQCLRPCRMVWVIPDNSIVLRYDKEPR